MPPKPKVKPSFPTKSSAFSASTLTSSNRRVSSRSKTRSGTGFTLPSPSPPSSPLPSEVLSDEDFFEIDGLDEALGHVVLLVENLGGRGVGGYSLCAVTKIVNVTRVLFHARGKPS